MTEAWPGHVLNPGDSEGHPARGINDRDPGDSEVHPARGINDRDPGEGLSKVQSKPVTNTELRTVAGCCALSVGGILSLMLQYTTPL